MKPMTADQILALPMQQNDAGASTIRDYLMALLLGIWTEGEGFSGKRPFGNSGWEHDLYIPLIKAGVIDGTLDDDGHIEDYDRKAGERVIHSAILAMGAGSTDAR